MANSGVRRRLKCSYAWLHQCRHYGEYECDKLKRANETFWYASAACRKTAAAFLRASASTSADSWASGSAAQLSRMRSPSCCMHSPCDHHGSSAHAGNARGPMPKAEQMVEVQLRGCVHPAQYNLDSLRAVQKTGDRSWCMYVAAKLLPCTSLAYPFTQTQQSPYCDGGCTRRLRNLAHV